jgi:predicted MFS family arabinose efflux permease
VREFRALWLSEVLSVTGDRLALVAVALLVYDRTRSPLLAAVTYAAGYLPWVVGGLFLAGLADRRPRRSVMVTCDAARAVLVAAMVVPHAPLWVLVALLFATTMFAPPFESARAAITPDILDGERYTLGTAVIQTTFLAGQVAGAAAGGAAVALIGVRPSLVVDCVTFVLSGLLIGLGTRSRPAASPPDTVRPSAWARIGEGFGLVFGDRALRTLLLFGWLVVFYTIPEGVAAPYAASLGGGPAAAGLVLASTAAATAVGTPLFTRFLRPRRRLDLMGPLAVLTCATLMLTVLRPGLALSLVIFSVSAAFGVYQIAANTAFVVRVPAGRRAQAFAIANMGVVVGQGAAFIAAGAAATVLTPAQVIAAGGGIGTVVALVLTLSWRHLSPPGGRHAAGRRPGHAAAGKARDPQGYPKTGELMHPSGDARRSAFNLSSRESAASLSGKIDYSSYSGPGATSPSRAAGSADSRGGHRWPGHAADPTAHVVDSAASTQARLRVNSMGRRRG